MEVPGAQQAVATHADSAVDGIKERATVIAAGELRRWLEEDHANRGRLTEGGARAAKLTRDSLISQIAMDYELWTAVQLPVDV